MNSVFNWVQLITIAGAAALFFVRKIPLKRFSRLLVWLAIVILFLTVKADGANIAACLRGFTANLSLTSVFLVFAGIYRFFFQRQLRFSLKKIYLPVAVAFGVLLYLTAFGLLKFDIYTYGFDFVLAGGILTALALLSLPFTVYPAVIVIIIIALELAGVLPYSNIIDAVFDVPLWLYCCIKLGTPVLKKLSKFRNKFCQCSSAIFVCFAALLLFSVQVNAVDYQEEGRVQSTDTLQPDGLPCTACDVSKDVPVKPAEKKDTGNSLPITVYADRLFYDKGTGSVAAAAFDGKSVIIEYDGKKLTAEALFGSLATQNGFVPGPVKVVGDKLNLTGKDIYVDANGKTANIKAFEGKISSSYFSGESADITEKKITVYNSIVTSCPANIPDYHISAERMEIFPNDRMVLYNAHIYLKNYEIASLREFSVLLGKKKDNYIPYPSVGWWSDTGFWISEDISLPLFVNNSYLDIELAYYQKLGFAPNASISYDGDYVDANLVAGFQRDDQGNWIKKLPDLSVKTPSVKLGKLPVSLQFSASSGVWVSTTQQSFHNTVQAYFQGDAIELPWKSTLSLGTGGLGVWDGPQSVLVFSDVPQAAAAFNSTALFDAVFNKKITDKLSGALEFHYQRQQTQIFDFNNPNATCAGVWGLVWTPFDKDMFSLRQTLNLQTLSQTQLDMTWMHNWHCWNTVLTYHWSTGVIEFSMPMAAW